MAHKVLRGAYGTSAEIAAYTGPAREIVINTDDGSLHVQDGVTAGGTKIARSVYASSNIPNGSAISLAVSGTAYNITSLNLTRVGEYDISASVRFGGTTGITNFAAGINLTSASLPTLNDTISAGNGPWTSINGSYSQGMIVPVGTGRLVIAGATTVYLIGSMSYSGSAPTASGFLRARWLG